MSLSSADHVKVEESRPATLQMAEHTCYCPATSGTWKSIHPSKHHRRNETPTTSHINDSQHTADLDFLSERDTLYGSFQRTIMSEVTFAKSFLSTLDKKPVKLAADHVSDPKQYANQSPVCIMYVGPNARLHVLKTIAVHPPPSNPPIPPP